jgi:hypothetical protein
MPKKIELKRPEGESAWARQSEQLQFVGWEWRNHEIRVYGRTGNVAQNGA